ncbi:adenylyltransferase/cytidyltransferase family protein [Cupriavidus pauculus]|uniref:adenylyltransferase/cytidyltransferase family protein n=1 Tax=Cupriavidus pauculus TaxID=82633 RepID=UPI001EE2F221|nr:adenylyltransferase/cytidyltransferase family protein [Cupriavidus pauculus]GJG97649.1 adenylyltransferase/cytidyltransferase family protein [Cupriavidus pauculus]
MTLHTLDLRPNRAVITYGTFDLFHIGHVRLLERIRQMGTTVIVAVATDEFAAERGERTVISYQDRADIVRNFKGVDFVIPETSWDQKAKDIAAYDIDVLAMGSKWRGRLGHLAHLCDIQLLQEERGASEDLLTVRNSRYFHDVALSLSISMH